MNRLRLIRLITAVFVVAGCLLVHAQTRAGYVQHVNQNNVTLSFTSTKNPSNIGDGTAAVLQVSGPGVLTPTGLVTFTAMQTGVTVGLAATAAVPLDSTGRASWTFNLAPGTYQLLASYSGDTEYDPADATPFLQTVLGPADFSLTLDPGPLVVKQGSTWTGMLTATSVNNFNGVVTLTCDGGGSAVFMSCLPGQPLKVTAAAPTKFPVQVTTTITVLNVVNSSLFFLFSLSGAAKGRRRRYGMYSFAMLSFMLLLSGCGNQYEQKDGTPKGSYKMTFVGTSGNLSHAVSLTIAVQ